MWSRKVESKLIENTHDPSKNTPDPSNLGSLTRCVSVVTNTHCTKSFGPFEISHYLLTFQIVWSYKYSDILVQINQVRFGFTSNYCKFMVSEPQFKGKLCGCDETSSSSLLQLLCCNFCFIQWQPSHGMASSAPFSSSTTLASSSSPFAMTNLVISNIANLIPIKLDSTNFLLWKSLFRPFFAQPPSWAFHWWLPTSPTTGNCCSRWKNNSQSRLLCVVSMRPDAAFLD